MSTCNFFCLLCLKYFAVYINFYSIYNLSCHCIFKWWNEDDLYLIMSSWTRSSQSELRGRNTWGAFQNPIVHAAPRLIRLESLGFGCRYQDFLTLPSWFQHAAKFENQWMEQRSTSALSHSQWPKRYCKRFRASGFIIWCVCPAS